MTERQEWKPTPEDIAKAPHMNVPTRNGEHVLYPWNTAMFTFVGRLAVWNHIYHWGDAPAGEGETAPRQVAFYLPEHWRETPRWRERYKKMGDYMVQNHYMQHLNATEVSSTDQEAILRLMEQDIGKADDITELWTQ